jgi:hypothetical protein
MIIMCIIYYILYNTICKLLFLFIIFTIYIKILSISVTFRWRETIPTLLYVAVHNFCPLFMLTVILLLLNLVTINQCFMHFFKRYISYIELRTGLEALLQIMKSIQKHFFLYICNFLHQVIDPSVCKVLNIYMLCVHEKEDISIYLQI